MQAIKTSKIDSYKTVVTDKDILKYNSELYANVALVNPGNTDADTGVFKNAGRLSDAIADFLGADLVTKIHKVMSNYFGPANNINIPSNNDSANKNNLTV